MEKIRSQSTFMDHKIGGVKVNKIKAKTFDETDSDESDMARRDSTTIID